MAKPELGLYPLVPLTGLPPKAIKAYKLASDLLSGEMHAYIGVKMLQNFPKKST